jgi:hypothetical protein
MTVDLELDAESLRPRQSEYFAGDGDIGDSLAGVVFE